VDITILVELLIQGYSNKAIAEELGIGLSPVKNHISTAVRKIGINEVCRSTRSRIALVRHFGNFPVPQGEIVVPESWSSLTPLEKKIVEYIVNNASNADIGKSIDRSEGRTKNIIKEICNKTGMFSRLELVVWYGRIFGFAKNGDDGGSTNEQG
jgi:DNA-binding CsgD family transcriptional regulator